MFERYAYRYSSWDDTQQVDPYSADDLMESMADHLIEDGDPERALQDLIRRGDRGQMEKRLIGLRELRQRLADRRREMMSRHNLDQMIEDIAGRLDEIVALERGGIERRLDETSDPSYTTLVDDTADAPSLDSESLQRMLQSITARKKEQLDQLPGDPAGRIKALSEYDFMNSEARQRFEELVTSLEQQVMQSLFKGMQDAIDGMTPEDLVRSREMVRDLNEMLEDRMAGREPRFDQFMDLYGDMFPGVEDLDGLLESIAARTAAMNSLMQSMSPAMRGQLQEMMDSVIGDDRLRVDLLRLAANLSQIFSPGSLEGQPYPFSGEQSLGLGEAMAMMERLAAMETLEEEMMAAESGRDIQSLDPTAVGELIDPESAAALERLQNVEKMLEDAGFLRREGDRLELTSAALRKIGQKALRDVFTTLKADGFGNHTSLSRGIGGERLDESKPYEYGDPLFIDVKSTLMNAVARGSGTPVRMVADDFQVYRTEMLTQSATVLLIDKSRSMFLNGLFLPAKKVALALDALIRGQFPRDSLYLVEFSYMAAQIQPSDLPLETWDEDTYGTNFQHGIMLARRLLAGSRARNKTIIIVTDGEPTAHIEDGIPYFNYPTTRQCLVETLREVGRATRENIIINTFMLETTPGLSSFVERMTRINNGRAFYAAPDRLGEYILVDYVRRKRGRVGES